MNLNRKIGLVMISAMSLLLIACCLKANAVNVKDITWITFLTPINKAPQSDPFEYKDINGLTGEIAYSQTVKDGVGGEYTTYVVVRTIKNGVQSNIISLPVVKTGASIFDIQLSPNGRYVLFKAGAYGDYYDTYNLFYWDLKTKQVFPGPPEELTYYRVNWSPSSRYITYCLGGNVNGDQYGVPNMNRPLRLYTYDTQSMKSHFIAQGQGVINWIWGNNDNLIYAQTEFDRQWVEGGKNPIESKPLELNNTYQNSATGGTGELIFKEAVPLAVSPNGSKVFLDTYYDSDVPKDKKEKPLPHQLIFYSHPCIYDVQQQKLVNIKDLGYYFTDARFISNTQLLLSDYSYINTTGTLTIKLFDTIEMKTKIIARVSETDSEETGNRAIYQPQFGFFRWSKDKKIFLFSSRHEGEKLDKNRFDIPVHLNLLNIESSNNRIICESRHLLSFSWGPIFEGELQ